ncbi:MAG: hypothetical protein IT353_13165, partial [Gemmatimonadaceae bacterium]|nr:hypothetical protein [Gemmatimonadaceae bacterium]
MSKRPQLPDAPDRPEADQEPSARQERPRKPGVRQRARVGGIVPQERSPKAMAVSFLLHFVVAFIVLQLLTFGHGLSGFLKLVKPDEPLEERLTYVETRPTPPKVAEVKPVTPPVRPTTPTETFVSPTTEPSAPAAPAAPPRADTGSGGSAAGTGNGVGAIDPNVRGVKPSLEDPRVWPGTSGNGVARTQRDGSDRLDSIMGFAITSARDSLDSLARAQGKYGRQPGDWTKTTKDGEKWGWDQKGIRLGKVTIPNALLGLLPMNAATGAMMSGNYTSMERERRLSTSREDIARMSERSLGDADFRKLANELRDRRERERRDRLKAP